MAHTDFELVSGGIIGRDHREIPKNCQDSACIIQGKPSVMQANSYAVGIVTDGCGAGEHSEVGAKLGARLLCEAVRCELERHSLERLDWHRIRQDVLAPLHVMAMGMGGDFRQVVKDYFLFTTLGVVRSGESSLFFSLGDGVMIVNDEITRLGPFENNSPPYLGYLLLGSSLVEMDPQALNFVVTPVRPLEEIEHFLLGSDGVVDLMALEGQLLPGMTQRVGGISQFWETDKYFWDDQLDPIRSSVLLSRRLKLAARDWPRVNPQPGLLRDDTTLIVGRRKAVTELA